MPGRFRSECHEFWDELNSLRREKYDYLKMKLKRNDMYYYGFGERIEEEGGDEYTFNRTD